MSWIPNKSGKQTKGQQPQRPPSRRTAQSQEVAPSHVAPDPTLRPSDEAPYGTRAEGSERRTDEGGEPGERRRRRVPRIDPMEEAMLKLSIEDTSDVGRLGQTITLLTNFFELETLPKFVIQEYMVIFDPECVRRRHRLTVLNSFRKEFLGPFAYDGMKLFVANKLQPDVEGSDEIVRPGKFRNQEYHVTLKHVNVVAPNTLPYIQLLGVLFRDKLYRLNFRTINRNLYELDQQHRVQEESIYLFPGVKSSILPRGENKKLLLCVDKLHKIINSSTLDEYMYSFEKWDQNDKDEVKRFLIGQSVVTRYNMNSYRIDDVDFDMSIESTFEQNGRQVSYIDYYKEHYNEKLRCRDLPLLAVRSKRADGSRSSVYLVPELCYLSGVNTGMGGNLNIMRSLAKHCGPVNRINYIRSVLKRIHDSVNKDYQETGLHWGLQINQKPKEIKGRCMPPLQPLMDGGRVGRNWPQVCSSTMLRATPLKSWVVLHSRSTDVNSLLNGIWETMNRLGMQPTDPIVQSLDGDSVRHVNDCLQRLKAQNQLDSKQLILFVQQDRMLDKNYKELKKVFSQHYGLITQFIKGKNCRAKPAVHQKIALQIGCKIGGEAWAMQLPFQKPTMILGVDCYHSRGMSSVAACVATLNRYCTRYYSRCCIQQEGQELVSALCGFIENAFQTFSQVNNGKFPSQLIVYRDGVGDGQLRYIQEHEISQISHATKAINPDCSLVFIVVKKQGSARFFIQQGHGGGPESLANPPAGTIIDHTVTNSNWRDFYMIPQKVTQGTATPSHYNIVLDEAGFQMDFIQDITYKLCHMYFNWTGPIRVPAVCQYAHKLAFLVGTCMSGEPQSSSMYNKLYYL